MICLSYFTLIAVLVVPVAAALPKPNFTGTWKVNLQKSKLQIPPPESSVFVVEHAEPSLRLTRTHVFQGKSDTFTMQLTTDSKEVVHQDDKRTIYSRAYWKGNVLVFDSRVVVKGAEATNVVRYRMAKDGQSFTARERLRSPQRNYENVRVMEKQK